MRESEPNAVSSTWPASIGAAPPCHFAAPADWPVRGMRAKCRLAPSDQLKLPSLFPSRPLESPCKPPVPTLVPALPSQ